MDNAAITQYLKAEAARLGFDACGVAPAGALSEEQQYIQHWLDEGMHAGMDYMTRNVDKRTDPRLLVPGAKSVVCLLMSYKPRQEQLVTLPQVARYAYGNDYHSLIRTKLHRLLAALRQVAPQCEGRGFTDSAPVLERAWAVQAGLTARKLPI